MSDTPQVLLAHHLKALKLPTFLREYDKLARQCASEGAARGRPCDRPPALLRRSPPARRGAGLRALLRPLRKLEWVVYAKRPFAGPEAVLAYLSRYTHRVAIANSRLIRFDDHGVTFTWKDYRAKGRDRYKVMTLATPEFIRRFLLHVLPHGFHRIRH